MPGNIANCRLKDSLGGIVFASTQVREIVGLMVPGNDDRENEPHGILVNLRYTSTLSPV